MFSQKELAEVSVRAPWKEELNRVPDLSKGLRQAKQRWDLKALIAGSPERIVGLAGLAWDRDSDAVDGQLYFRTRPRYTYEGSARLLLDQMVEQARGLKLKSLGIKTNTASHLDTFLRASGFRTERTEEVWSVDLQKVVRRLEPISKKWKPRVEWNLRSLEDSDLPALAALIAPFERVSADRLHVRKQGEVLGTGYEGYASSVVEVDGQLIGALLTKDLGGLTGYIEFRVVGEDYQQHSGLLGAMMLYRSACEALKQDFGKVLFTVNVGRDFETRNLAHRMKGGMVDSQCFLRLDL